MSWQPELDDIARRRQLAARMGGPDKVKRQHDNGKLTVRERIEGLVDADSFTEIGSLAGKAEYGPDGELVDFTPSNLVMGHARLNDRPVVVVGDDFTVRGGANDGAVGDKLITAERMAHDLRLPMVRLVDGTGGGGSVKTIEAKGYTNIPTMRVWEHVVHNMTQVPVVSLALGSVAGMGAARVAASHYSVMVKGTAQLFNAGPAVVKRIGEDIDKEGLGGSRIHTRNGVVDDEVATEAEAFERARRFLSYLPNSVHELPARGPVTDDANRRDEWLVEAIPRDPRKVYKIRPILETLVDQGSFFEMGRHFGKALVTGLARIDGWPVAVLGSDPYFYGGGWDRASAEKVTRFCDLAQAFQLPIVNLVDIAGFLIGSTAEQSGVMRAGVRALSAVYQCQVPWFTVIVRKAYGVAAAAHQNHSRYNFRYAWPSANWGSLPIEGGLEVAYKAEIEAAPDPAAKAAEIEERVRRLTSPLRSAEAFIIEEMLDPRDTRRMLSQFVNVTAHAREAGPKAFGLRP